MAATDAELVRTCLAGDIEAFGVLVERYRDALYGLCYARVGDFELARDLAQEAFVSAYQALAGLRDPARFAPWLRRIAENVCSAQRRRRKVAREPLDCHTLAAHGDLADQVANSVALEAALRSLPESNRLAISLFYVNGYTHEEIGRFLSVPASTVKGRLRDGRARLRKHLVAMIRDLFEEKALPPEFGGRVMQRIREVKVGEEDSQPVMLLTDERGKALPIWIGPSEATMLKVALAGRDMPRPLTYDLFLCALSAFAIRVARVEIAGLREQTYMANLELTRGKQTRKFDARPSDAINLALRAKAPIFVADDAALAQAMLSKAAVRKRFPAEWKIPEAEPLCVGKGDPLERTLRTIVGAAAVEKAGAISIGPRPRHPGQGSVAFVSGSQRKEVMALPSYVLAPLRGRLAEMAGIRLNPGARSQRGTITTEIANQKHELRVAFTPSRITLKVVAARKR